MTAVYHSTPSFDFERQSILSSLSSGSTLPAYSPRPRTQQGRTSEHVYSRVPSGNALALRFKSDAPSSNSTPAFSDLGRVEGNVSLNIVNKSDIISVSVRVRCIVHTVAIQIVLGGAPTRGFSNQGDTKVMTEVSTIVWPSTSGLKETLAKGQHSWNFSLSVPSTIIDPKTGTKYPLPPTFLRKGCPQQIQYQMEVILCHKGYFSEDYSLITRFRYTPRTMPSQPSSLRRAAYADRTILPPPEFDPQGYKIFPFRRLGVKVFGARHTELELLLALPKPNHYPRGYPIPCFVTLISNDASTLDLLASPQSIKLSLKRTLLCGLKSDKKEVFEEDVVGEGRCWLPSNTDYRFVTTSRMLQGEIYVPEELDPSFDAPSLTLDYAITVSLQAPGLTFSNSKSSCSPAFSAPVIIARSCVPGPKPLSFAPVPVSFGYGRG